MDRIVYILGAGFSQPLGLPVMSNFLEKSKDMYFAHRDIYPHFLTVFDTIRSMSFAKNYYYSDLSNIEEVLSILDMNNHVTKRKQEREAFIKYIVDVIKFYTPPITDERPMPSRWQDHIFGNNELWNLYGGFIGSIFNLIFDEYVEVEHENKHKKVKCEIGSELPRFYSIVTLNYDLIFENLCDYVNRNYFPEGKVEFFRSTSFDNAKRSSVLAKLHGSADSGIIVPPTWNKGFSQEEIELAWQVAYNVLSNANQIRIIGYSLPETDSYIRYLLKASVINSQHLRKIDIICLDPSKQIKKRYKNFIHSNSWKFISGDVKDYLEMIIKRCRQVYDYGPDKRKVSYYAIEHAHKEFMESTNNEKL